MARSLLDIWLSTHPISDSHVLCAGKQCPICHDSLKGPLKLQCGHLYCKDCIGQWLDREKTCPMCRSAVVHDSLIPHDDGATTLWPTLF